MCARSLVSTALKCAVCYFHMSCHGTHDLHQLYLYDTFWKVLVSSYFFCSVLFSFSRSYMRSFDHFPFALCLMLSILVLYISVSYACLVNCLLFIIDAYVDLYSQNVYVRVFNLGCNSTSFFLRLPYIHFRRQALCSPSGFCDVRFACRRARTSSLYAWVASSYFYNSCDSLL